MSVTKDGRARRTLKACVICHKKKVRCDIDDIPGEVCTPCARDGYECVPRERKRKRFTFSPSPPAQRRPKSKSLNAAESGDLNGAASLTMSNRDSFSSMNVGFIGTAKSEDGVECSGSTSYTGGSPLVAQQTEPSYPSPIHNGNRDVPESTHGVSSYNVSYLGRLEYLRNDVPVNDDAGLPNEMPRKLSDTDLAILKLQRVEELPPKPIRDSLMEAFWARCYPWTPVVERDWVSDRRSSLLLQHAMLLAGSRVSPPHKRYPPNEFYTKAKVLFWMGAERDPIITIAATLLLHWWNPEGPESVSIDTSSFWLRICTGLAYQVGLHREPTGKPNAGLRKRIWWSLVVRDCLINAGHGRPRAIDLKLAGVSPISTLDFDGALTQASLFSSYVGISCILGDLTQSYLRKHGLQEHKKSLEDRLFRWLKTLPDHLQLCHSTEGRPPKDYNIETWQLHIQYFTVVVILNRSPDGNPSTASLLASSFIASIFADLMARDQLQYLGPIFTFYCLTAGMAQLSCYRYGSIVQIAKDNLSVLTRALEELGTRWPTAVGSLKHLMDVREKVMQRPSLGHSPDVNLPATAAQFFSDFGPELCSMWVPVHQRLPQNTSIAPRELETAGTLQRLRRPTAQSIDLDVAVQQRMLNSQAVAGATLEPTMLQPQEWFGPYGGMANWLMVNWDQGLGW
ncbi:hypothetical protein P171DRAFT_75055 [Karstenula rhodostoma CBS 690.94]|uniref:Zn(2)-C6 fungal-type domain-containing protein n=1 Tax=Karstenula rhodostoma CBS 690.94 TaxID=1392251 RepID=A0A9P4U8W8_9PLEO|nr:hypothetical protein P171DRAFT_75055 [Karstenula rhodostoma CBS 690.94]